MTSETKPQYHLRDVNLAAFLLARGRALLGTYKEASGLTCFVFDAAEVLQDIQEWNDPAKTRELRAFTAALRTLRGLMRSPQWAGQP